MSQRSNEWHWDAVARRYYCYSPRARCEVFEDGTPRHLAQQPRNLPSRSHDPPPAATQYSTSPQSRANTYEIRAAAPLAAPRDSSTSNVRTAASVRQEDRFNKEQQAQLPLTHDFANINLNANARPPQQTEQREWTASNGNQYVDARDPASQVQTTLQVGPAEKITDPVFYKQGIRATQLLLPTAGEEEKLFEEYKRREQPRRFFTRGKVFRVLWTEPAGDNRTAVTFQGVTTGIHGESVFSKIRLFVVIREADNYCSALPIVSYNGQGVAKPGVTKSEYSVIYSGKTPPPDFADEAPRRGEEGMRPDAIRVNPDDRTDLLTPRSRIHYGKVHTIEHNIKVKPYGQVHPGSVAALRHQFLNVWLGEAAAGAVARSGSDSGTSNNPPPARSNQKQPVRRPSQSVPNTSGSSSTPAQGTTGSREESWKASARAAVQRLMLQGLTQEEAIEIVQAQDRALRSSESRAANKAESDSDPDTSDEETEAPISSKRSGKAASSSSRTAEAKQLKQSSHPPRVDSRGQEPEPPPRRTGSSLPTKMSTSTSSTGYGRSQPMDTVRHKGSESISRPLDAERRPDTQARAPAQLQYQQAQPTQQQRHQQSQTQHQQSSQYHHQQQPQRAQSQQQRQPHSQTQNATSSTTLEYYIRYYVSLGYSQEQAVQFARTYLAQQQGGSGKQ